MSLDSFKVRSEFPALSLTPGGQPLVYLDTAATALKPRAVIMALDHFHRFEAANVHRGAHYLSDKATEKFEASRETVRAFVNARSTGEIVFTGGTTDSINLVAQSFGEAFVKPADEIVVTEMEHHSNLVPWQRLAVTRGAVLRVVRVTSAGELDLGHYRSLLGEKTKLVAFTHCSNALGTVNPAAEMTRLAHAAGAKVLIDAAQSAAIMKIDVQEVGCDFLAFSSHKLFGPYGTGILYGAEDLLNSMPPYRTGGSMVDKVSLTEGTTFLPSPQRFEAGTPNIGGVVGMAAAIEFFNRFDIAEVFEHDRKLLTMAENALRDIDGVEIHGKSATRASILSFTLKGAHASDIGSVLDQQGVAVRAGHHCAQPLMKSLGVSATARASFSIYNNESDVEKLVKAIIKAKEILT